SNKGDATSATALNTLAVAASGSPSFKFGSLLDVSGGYNNAAAISTNLLDLVGATAELANNDSFFEVDALGITVPGVTSINTNDTVTLSATTNAVKLYVGQVTPDSAFTNTSAPASVNPATLATGTVLGIPINITASNNMTFAGANGQSVTLGPGAYTRYGWV